MLIQNEDDNLETQIYDIYIAFITDGIYEKKLRDVNVYSRLLKLSTDTYPQHMQM